MSSYLKHMDPLFPSSHYQSCMNSLDQIFSLIQAAAFYLIVEISPLGKISKLTILNTIPTCPRHSKCILVRHGCSHKRAALPSSGSSHFCCLTWSKVWKTLYYLKCNRLETLAIAHGENRTVGWLRWLAKQNQETCVCSIDFKLQRLKGNKRHRMFKAWASG